MTITRATPSQTAPLQQWIKTNADGTDAAKLSLGQMQQAARELKVPLAQVTVARDALVLASAARTNDAGVASKSLRDAASGARVGQGGRALSSSPALARFTAHTPAEAVAAFKSAGYSWRTRTLQSARSTFPPSRRARNSIGGKVLSGQVEALNKAGITPSKYDAQDQTGRFQEVHLL